MNNTHNVLNTIQASGADADLENRKLSITGAPVIDFVEAESTDGLKESLAEGLQSVIITPSVVNDFKYSFIISQYNKALGINVEEYISYKSLPSGETATTICNALRNVISAQTKLKITTGGTSTLILTGQSGAPTFNVKLTSLNLTLAANQSQKTNSTIASGVVTTSTAHGWKTGQKVVIDSSTSGDGTYRITFLTTTTFKLNGSTNTSATPGTSTEVAQQSNGQYSDLVANGVSGGLVGESYSVLSIGYKKTGITESGGVLSMAKNNHSVYVIEPGGDIEDTNYVALKNKLTDIVGAVSGGVANAEAVALA